MVKKGRVLYAILKSNFAGWIVNYKIYIVAFILTVFSLDNYANVFKYAKEAGFRVTPFLFPFLFTHPFMHLVIFTGIIFLFANAPFVNSLQLLMISRSGKKIWCVAQIIYLIICTMILTVFLIVLPLVRYVDMIALKKQWGKIWTTLAVNSNLVNPSSYYVINRYTPKESLIYTIVIFMLISLFIGLLIMFCNTYFRNKSIGIVITALFVIFDWMADITGSSVALWISPMSWISISKMAYSRDTTVPSTTFAIAVLSCINIILIVGTYFISKQRDVVAIVNEE